MYGFSPYRFFRTDRLKGLELSQYSPLCKAHISSTYDSINSTQPGETCQDALTAPFTSLSKSLSKSSSRPSAKQQYRSLK